MRSFMVTTFLCISVAGLLTAAIGLPRHEPPLPGSVRLRVFARGPVGLGIEGSSSAVVFEADASKLAFTLPLESIDTDIDLRNRHLRELLEVERFPVALLEVARTAVVFPAAGRTTEGAARAELTLHGTTRPVAVKYRAERGTDGRIVVDGSVLIDLPDYGLVAPTYLGLSVAPQVKVTAELSLEHE